MKRVPDIACQICAAAISALAVLVLPGTAHATFTLVHVFKGGTTDGAVPNATLLSDGQGNLFGTTVYGGTNNTGTVFKIASGGTFSIIYSFQGGSDGAYPQGTLAMDQNNNIYGTTSGGGAYGDGTIFEITPRLAESIPWSFEGGSDGATPFGGVIIDSTGVLHGTTTYGGAPCSGLGCGTVFEYSALNGESVAYSFQGGSDGANPIAGLVLDTSGNVYGTTYSGGSNGVGTIFQVNTNNVEKVLYSFGSGTTDGAYPASPLALSKGNLYGTTTLGGGSSACTNGCGTLYSLSSNGTETVMHAFQGVMVDGAFPVAGVTIDGSGNLFGSTCGTGSAPPNCNFYAGPGKTCSKGCANGSDFEQPGCCDSSRGPVAPGTFIVLHRFTGLGGSGPSAAMLLNNKLLYGTTEYGGYLKCKAASTKRGCGVIYTQTP
jgi:uncharacterized repeat protein (TIGR03803 family)